MVDPEGGGAATAAAVELVEHGRDLRVVQQVAERRAWVRGGGVGGGGVGLASRRSVLHQVICAACHPVRNSHATRLRPHTKRRGEMNGSGAQPITAPTAPRLGSPQRSASPDGPCPQPCPEVGGGWVRSATVNSSLSSAYTMRGDTVIRVVLPHSTCVHMEKQ